MCNHFLEKGVGVLPRMAELGRGNWCKWCALAAWSLAAIRAVCQQGDSITTPGFYEVVTTQGRWTKWALKLFVVHFSESVPFSDISAEKSHETSVNTVSLYRSSTTTIHGLVCEGDCAVQTCEDARAFSSFQRRTCLEARSQDAINLNETAARCQICRGSYRSWSLSMIEN